MNMVFSLLPWFYLLLDLRPWDGFTHSYSGSSHFNSLKLETAPQMCTEMGLLGDLDPIPLTKLTVLVSELPAVHSKVIILMWG